MLVRIDRMIKDNEGGLTKQLVVGLMPVCVSRKQWGGHVR
jgi:hypothetical protein